MSKTPTNTGTIRHTDSQGLDSVNDVVETKVSNFAHHMKDDFAYGAHTSNQFAAVCLNGGGCLAYAAAPSITAASIPRIEGAVLPANVDRITLSAIANDDGASPHNYLGWLIQLNAGGESQAATDLVNALKVAAGNDVMAYGVETTPDAVLPNIIRIPANGETVTIDIDFTLTDVFILPIAFATTGVGVLDLAIDLGVPA